MYPTAWRQFPHYRASFYSFLFLDKSHPILSLYFFLFLFYLHYRTLFTVYKYYIFTIRTQGYVPEKAIPWFCYCSQVVLKTNTNTNTNTTKIKSMKIKRRRRRRPWWWWWWWFFFHNGINACIYLRLAFFFCFSSCWFSFFFFFYFLKYLFIFSKLFIFTRHEVWWRLYAPVH